jgi:hypothetical protein
MTSARAVPRVSAEQRAPRLWSLLLIAATLSLAGCERFQRKHIPVDKVEELGYPGCAGAGLSSTRQLGSEHLRAGPSHSDKSVVERYRIEQRDCIESGAVVRERGMTPGASLIAVTVRQEWPLGTSDVEVIYDAQLLPLRIWKRMTLPGIERAAERADIRRYELRTDPVSVKLRSMEGRISFELLSGGRPRAVIGPGRGLISVWIRRARLQVGQKVRELAIDVRGLEKIELVTLQREADLQHRELGPVRVYTFHGRETVFVDKRDLVVGDLAGLRPDRLLHTDPPPPLPLYGPIDPVHTP